MKLKKTFTREGQALEVAVALDGDGHARARVGENTHELEIARLANGGLSLRAGDAVHTAFVVARGQRVQVRLDGVTYDLVVARGRTAAAAAASGAIEAPMTGTVIDVPVRVGDVVTEDRTVVVLSAMKMEHKLVAGVAGTVREVACTSGETVDQGRLLVRVEADVKA